MTSVYAFTVKRLIFYLTWVGLKVTIFPYMGRVNFACSRETGAKRSTLVVGAEDRKPDYDMQTILYALCFSLRRRRAD